jgi:hypothetical protein
MQWKQRRLRQQLDRLRESLGKKDE